MIRIALFLSIVLLASCSSPRYAARKSFRQHILKNEVHSKNFTGFALYDPMKAKMLFNHNDGRYFTPASNTKIYTLYTSLQILGDRLPALRYAFRNDTLFLMGTGDPSLMHPDLPDNGVLDWLRPYLDSQKMAFVQDNMLDEKYGSGWAWDDFNYAFSCQKSSLPVHGNFIRIEKEGQSIEVSPWGAQLVTDSEKSSSKAFRHSKNGNQLHFNPMTVLDSFEQDIPADVSSPYWALANIRHTLYGEAPFEFPPNQTIAQIRNPGGLSWQTLAGLPLDTLLIPFMHDSDNFFAEQLMLMVSGQLFDDSLSVPKAIQYSLDSLLPGLPDPPRWVDGSGLSRYNLFTPRDNVFILEKLFNEQNRERLLALFPAGGVSGTIKNWYAGPDGKPFIYAKTGTLSNNHSLSGYLQAKSGKWYIFSFMHNHYFESSSTMKRSMDRILREIYLNG